MHYLTQYKTYTKNLRPFVTRDSLQSVLVIDKEQSSVLLKRAIYYRCIFSENDIPMVISSTWCTKSHIENAYETHHKFSQEQILIGN